MLKKLKVPNHHLNLKDINDNKIVLKNELSKQRYNSVIFSNNDSKKFFNKNNVKRISDNIDINLKNNLNDENK